MWRPRHAVLTAQFYARRWAAPYHHKSDRSDFLSLAQVWSQHRFCAIQQAALIFDANNGSPPASRHLFRGRHSQTSGPDLQRLHLYYRPNQPPSRYQPIVHANNFETQNARDGIFPAHSRYLLPPHAPLVQLPPLCWPDYLCWHALHRPKSPGWWWQMSHRQHGLLVQPPKTNQAPCQKHGRIICLDVPRKQIRM